MAISHHSPQQHGGVFCLLSRWGLPTGEGGGEAQCHSLPNDRPNPPHPSTPLHTPATPVARMRCRGGHGKRRLAGKDGGGKMPSAFLS